MNINAIINGLAFPVRIAVIAGVIALIALSIFDLIRSGDAPVLQTVDTTPDRSVSVSDITRAELFGSADEPELFDVEELATTTLNLTLVTIVYDETNPELSTARIAQGTQKPKKFSRGDRVAGIANVSEVLRDRVILERTGQRELLAFATEYAVFELVENSITQMELNNPGTRQESESPNVNSDESEVDDESSSSVNSQRDDYEHFMEHLDRDPQIALQEAGLAPPTPVTPVTPPTSITPVNPPTPITPPTRNQTQGPAAKPKVAGTLGMQRNKVPQAIDQSRLKTVQRDLRRSIDEVGHKSTGPEPTESSTESHQHETP